MEDDHLSLLSEKGLQRLDFNNTRVIFTLIYNFLLHFNHYIALDFGVRLDFLVGPN